MRVITMQWTQRNVDRIHKWLGLVSDWRGHFSGLYQGYKTVGAKTDRISFHFHD